MMGGTNAEIPPPPGNAERELVYARFNPAYIFSKTLAKSMLNVVKYRGKGGAKKNG